MAEDEILLYIKSLADTGQIEKAKAAMETYVASVVSGNRKIEESNRSVAASMAKTLGVEAPGLTKMPKTRAQERKSTLTELRNERTAIDKELMIAEGTNKNVSKLLKRRQAITEQLIELTQIDYKQRGAKVAPPGRKTPDELTGKLFHPTLVKDYGPGKGIADQPKMAYIPQIKEWKDPQQQASYKKWKRDETRREMDLFSRKRGLLENAPEARFDTDATKRAEDYSREGIDVFQEEKEWLQEQGNLIDDFTDEYDRVTEEIANTKQEISLAIEGSKHASVEYQQASYDHLRELDAQLDTLMNERDAIVEAATTRKTKFEPRSEMRKKSDAELKAKSRDRVARQVRLEKTPQWVGEPPSAYPKAKPELAYPEVPKTREWYKRHGLEYGEEAAAAAKVAAIIPEEPVKKPTAPADVNTYLGKPLAELKTKREELVKKFMEFGDTFTEQTAELALPIAHELADVENAIAKVATPAELAAIYPGEATLDKLLKEKPIPGRGKKLTSKGEPTTKILTVEEKRKAAMARILAAANAEIGPVVEKKPTGTAGLGNVLGLGIPIPPMGPMLGKFASKLTSGLAGWGKWLGAKVYHVISPDMYDLGGQIMGMFFAEPDPAKQKALEERVTDQVKNTLGITAYKVKKYSVLTTTGAKDIFKIEGYVDKHKIHAGNIDKVKASIDGVVNSMWQETRAIDVQGGVTGKYNVGPWQERVGRGFDDLGKKTKKFAWGFTWMAMSMLGVYFSLNTLINLSMKGFQAMLRPLSDIENFFTSLGMAKMFGPEGMFEGFDMEKYIEAWKLVQGWMGTMTGLLGELGAAIVTDPEVKKAIDDLFKAFAEMVRDPKFIKMMQDLAVAMTDVAKGMLQVLPIVVGFVLWLSSVKAGDISLLQVILWIWASSLILMPVLSDLAAIVLIAGKAFSFFGIILTWLAAKGGISGVAASLIPLANNMYDVLWVAGGLIGVAMLVAEVFGLWPYIFGAVTASVVELADKLLMIVQGVWEIMYALEMAMGNPYGQAFKMLGEAQRIETNRANMVRYWESYFANLKAGPGGLLESLKRSGVGADLNAQLEKYNKYGRSTTTPTTTPAGAAAEAVAPPELPPELEQWYKKGPQNTYNITTNFNVAGDLTREGADKIGDNVNETLKRITRNSTSTKGV